MNQLGRLAGALLLESEAGAFLIGNLKRPCDFAAAGFVTPAMVDALVRPVLRLERLGEGAPSLAGVKLRLPDGDGATLAGAIAARLLIERNGAVSDRLWRLIVIGNGDPEDDLPEEGIIDARWLIEMPLPLWQIVREAVLKCS